MREPKDDAPREEKKASDFTPVGFSDVILPAKTPDNACLISGGREKKGKKRNGVHSRDAHTNTPTDDTREQTYGSGHQKKTRKKKEKTHAHPRARPLFRAKTRQEKSSEGWESPSHLL